MSVILLGDGLPGNYTGTAGRGQVSQAVAGAGCKLSNNKGSWFVTSPGSTIVSRSGEDLSVRCEKEAHQAGLTSAKSVTKPMAFGNIIFGGVIGVGVDISTGAAFDYPTMISVTMDGLGSTTDLAAVPGLMKTSCPSVWHSNQGMCK